jgi:hypothetical protein
MATRQVKHNGCRMFQHRKYKEKLLNKTKRQTNIFGDNLSSNKTLAR